MNEKTSPADAIVRGLERWDPESAVTLGELAADVLDQLESEGYAVVPVEATTRMVNRGADPVADKSMSPFETAMEIADAVWRAMVGARPRLREGR